MKKNNIMNFIKEYGVLVSVIFLPIIIITMIMVFSEPTTKENVHWHIPISYDLCGDTTQLKDSGQHGKLHGHDDNRAHIEGIIDKENRSETLGAFFNTTKIVFSKTQIGKYTNGDKCKGSENPGKVSVLINGKENFEFKNYVLNNGDKIKIIFK